MSIDLQGKIPNNVDLASDRRLQRALESWQPKFLDWWRERGPVLPEGEFYLRTAVSVEPNGWAHFDYVRPSEYRWGIFLTPIEAERSIAFGDSHGDRAWQEVPGELRAAARRLIVTQADTEPASVEQQRELGAIAPSLYDLRNLLQVNVEEARHLWAMAYLLFRHFGRDGREEAEELLARQSGSVDQPRILGAFNRPISTWLDFFCFATFTDRDGKFQLAALAESGFDPLARTCRFMLTEEAHHLFVGETGIRRVLSRSIELMQRDPNEDARAQGGIDLELLQRYINYWFSESLDLFGSGESSNAASYFATGLKGRFQESRSGRYEDHLLLSDQYAIERPGPDGPVVQELVPARRALNAMLQDAYVAECEKMVNRWNETLSREGIGFELRLPSSRFNRKIGPFAGLPYGASGDFVRTIEGVENDLPSDEDRKYVAALQTDPILERGQVANWLAAPSSPIDRKPLDFEYLRLD